VNARVDAEGIDMTLTDGVVTLRPWERMISRPCSRPAQDPEIARHTYVPRPYRLADARRLHRQAVRKPSRTARLRPASPSWMRQRTGFGRCRDRLWNGHRASFGYWLAPEAREGAWQLCPAPHRRLDARHDGRDPPRALHGLDNPAPAEWPRSPARPRGDPPGVGDRRDGHPIDVIFYVRIRE